MSKETQLAHITHLSFSTGRLLEYDSEVEVAYVAGSTAHYDQTPPRRSPKTRFLALVRAVLLFISTYWPSNSGPSEPVSKTPYMALLRQALKGRI
jgi:hypothetical protein